MQLLLSVRVKQSENAKKVFAEFIFIDKFDTAFCLGLDNKNE